MAHEMDGFARSLGFTDATELFRMITAVDLERPEVMAVFEVWKDLDGSRAGLEKILTTFGRRPSR